MRPNGHTLVSDFDNRDPLSDFDDIDTGKALAALSRLSQLTRMLVESNEWFVQLDPQGRPARIIRRRADEMLQGRDPDEAEFEFELSPDDAMAPGRYVQLSSQGDSDIEEPEQEEEELSLDPAEPTSKVVTNWVAPKDEWDLVYDTNAPQPDGTKGWSAPVFMQIRWKGHGTSLVFKQMEKRILFGKLPAGAFLYQQAQQMSPMERRRIWTLWWIQRAKTEGLEAVKGRKAAQTSSYARKLSAEEREKNLSSRAAEILRELRENYNV